MPDLTIFCDYHLDADALQLLRDGAAPHRVILPATPSNSFLAERPEDPRFAEADIAFGQPGLAGIAASNRLKWIQVNSAGYTRYDTPDFRALAQDRGLILTNSSSVFANPCAEHVFAFMLAQGRRLPRALRTDLSSSSSDVRDLRAAITCLTGQKVVILGFGAIGARLVELLGPLRMKVTAMRRRPRGDEGVPTFAPSALAAELADADHVVNILPENAESRGFCNEERFGWCQRGAAFYNIGRGATVDQPALVAALASGHLAAAWLDVTDPEPLPDGHPLLTAPNCFITPHVAGGHGREAHALIRHFLANLRLFLKGQPLNDRIF
jgi:phosphoglycerate dehydrogenase-like enzyme